MAVNKTTCVKKKKADRVPGRWFNYCRFKYCIPGTQILPIKAPLKQSYNSGLPNPNPSKTKVSLDNEFTPEQLIRELNSQGMRLSMVINVTNADQYYDKEEFESRSIQHYELGCWVGKLPPPYKCRLFADVVKNFLRLNKEGIIAVHCMNGVDMTGYLLCWFLIKYRRYSLDNAIKAFENARGHKIEEELFLDDLREKFQSCIPLMVRHHHDAVQKKEINKSKDGAFHPMDSTERPGRGTLSADKEKSTHCNHDAVQKRKGKKIKDGGLDPRHSAIQCPAPSQKHYRQPAKKQSTAHYNNDAVQKRAERKGIKDGGLDPRHSVQCQPPSQKDCRQPAKKQFTHCNHDAAVQKRTERKGTKDGGLDPRHSVQCQPPSQKDCRQPAKKQSAHSNHDAVVQKRTERKGTKDGGLDPRHSVQQCQAPLQKDCRQPAKKQSVHCNHETVQKREKKKQKRERKKIKDGGLDPKDSIHCPVPSQNLKHCRQQAKKQSAHCNHDHTVQKRGERKEIKGGGLDPRHSIQSPAPIGEHCHHQQAMSESHIKQKKRPEQQIKDDWDYYIFNHRVVDPRRRKRGERRRGKKKVKVWWERRMKEKRRLMIKKRIKKTLRKTQKPRCMRYCDDNFYYDDDFYYDELHFYI